MLGRGENLIFRVATIYYLNVQFLTKKLQVCQETKYGPLNRKENSKYNAIGMVSGEVQMLKSPDIDFKSAINQ